MTRKNTPPHLQILLASSLVGLLLLSATACRTANPKYPLPEPSRQTIKVDALRGVIGLAEFGEPDGIVKKRLGETLFTFEEEGIYGYDTLYGVPYFGGETTEGVSTIYGIVFNFDRLDEATNIALTIELTINNRVITLNRNTTLSQLEQSLGCQVEQKIPREVKFNKFKLTSRDADGTCHLTLQRDRAGDDAYDAHDDQSNTEFRFEFGRLTQVSVYEQHCPYG